ncbi:MAG: hypothetical protein IBX71_09165, partial [Candidatus Desulforudis sp.]|nr:hypothetical protein [Desulforudis sp.]
MENRRTELLFEPVDLDAGRLTLSIPALVVTEPGEAKLRLPIPQEGRSVTVNEELTLGRYPFTVTAVERDGERLRVWVDSGGPAPRMLLRFDLRPAPDWFDWLPWRERPQSRGWSWVSKHDEQTGQMEYFEIDLVFPAGDRVDLN